MRRFSLTRSVAPVLMGLALTAGVTMASAGTASASIPASCYELANAMSYHSDQGNYDYVQQLGDWYFAAGCPDFLPY
jgi:hypothetical protein